MSQKLRDQLTAGLEALGEDPLAHPCDTYLAYIELLLKWNKAYNLTAIDTEEKILTHHILDSLTVLPHIYGGQCIDVGTGAGLPGFILALARPQLSWVLLDSNKKKIRFINQAILELKPENIETVHTRCEDYPSRFKFSTIICRALTSLASFRHSALPLIQDDGRFLAMKGSRPEKELLELDSLDLNYSVHSLKIPGLDAERHIVVF